MKSRGLEYADYQRTTNAFLFPGSASAITAWLHPWRDHLPGRFGQPRASRLGGGTVRILTEDVFVQFFGMGQIGLAFFKLGGFEQLRCLILAASRAAQAELQWCKSAIGS